MSAFKLTVAAEADLKDIGRYTLQRWGHGQRNKYLSELDKAFRELARNPELGKKRDEIRNGYLSLLKNKHVIFYRRQKREVEIVRILHQSMEIERHLDELSP